MGAAAADDNAAQREFSQRTTDVECVQTGHVRTFLRAHTHARMLVHSMCSSRYGMVYFPCVCGVTAAACVIAPQKTSPVYSM